ncbi:hypothetical protein [Marinobacter sp.]|uniref:hypothetical protein n=1 Tax=Marinobacter sp. TaxID=50741 RepID=UPI0035C72B9B
MNRFRAMFLVVTLLSASGSQAEDARIVDAFHCTEVSNDIARLECFDNAYRAYRTSAEAPGDWLTKTEVSPIDDTVTSLAAINARDRKNGLAPHNQLIIRCEGTELDIWIAWRNLITIEATLTTTRVGQQKASTKHWNPGEPSYAKFYPGNTRTLLRDLIRADRFVARVVEGLHEGETAIFDLIGLEKAIEPMRAACLPRLPTDPREREMESLLRYMDKSDPSPVQR